MKSLDDFKKIIYSTSKETGIDLPEGYKYRYAPYSCWKCHKDMIIFVWSGTSVITNDDLIIPPEPKPKSIQERFTNMSGQAYWANVCPSCNNVQGDFFIRMEPDSPFFSNVREVVDSEEAFNKDMDNISKYYFEQLKD